MTVLVVGQERTGTHSLANMLNASGLISHHESSPTLCFEAYNRVIKNTFRQEIVIQKIKSLEGKAESNHRLQFFVDIIAKEIPDAKFIFLVRDPVKVISSMMGTMAHWPGRTNLPNWYMERIERYIIPTKREFNLYRIPPHDFKQPLPIMLLDSWLRGLMVSLPLLERLGNRLRLLRTGKINSDGKKVWEWLELNWSDSVANEAYKKSDSMYDLFQKDNLSSWAKDQVAPHINRIYKEFDSTLNGFPLGKKILDMIYHKE